MSATLVHPTRDELIRCASAGSVGEELLSIVRRHLEEERCDPCSETVFDALAASGGARRDVALIQRWIRPSRVARGGGTRIGMAADYQLVCTAGPYALDVLVRDDESKRELRFVGQVTRAGQILEPVADLPLRLVGVPVSELASSSTDDFGEFAFSSHRDGMYGLRLGADSSSPCVMVWEGWDD